MVTNADLTSDVVTPALVAALRATYALSWSGIHGARHWLRVRENGLRLTPLTGADPVVVELFAVIHDIKRQNDGYDPRHGARAAKWVQATRPLLPIDAGRLEVLMYACEAHTRGLTQAEITVQTCWDADRLDLYRVGIMPQPARLCTDAARIPAVLKWAVARSSEEPGGEPPGQDP
jgi:uncharacterized protein